MRASNLLTSEVPPYIDTSLRVRVQALLAGHGPSGQPQDMYRHLSFSDAAGRPERSNGFGETRRMELLDRWEARRVRGV